MPLPQSMPKPRSSTNKSLPKYWRWHKGRYRYRPPKHLRHKYGDKDQVTLGKTLHEAYATFASFHDRDISVVTLADLVDRYILEVVPEHESANTRRSKLDCLGRIRLVMGDTEVELITPQFIYQYRDYIGKAKSKKYANLDLEVLSHCFTKAIEWGVVSEHPMTNKKVVKFPLKSRDRYVEDWELQEWAKVANPFLLVYVTLKGVTGLRQQDLLTIRHDDITDVELRSKNLKTNKIVRFPLFAPTGKPTTVKQALDVIGNYYGPNNSEWLFHNRKNECYYSVVNRTASGFQSIWYRSMAKAIKETKLIEKFTEHDLRSKVGSDLDTDLAAQTLLAHSSAAITTKHYRRRGQVVDPAQGFLL